MHEGKKISIGLWLAIILSVVKLPVADAAWLPCFAARQQTPDFGMRVRLEGADVDIPVPGGMRAAEFKEFVDVMLRDGHTDAAIFWGSRTHFRAGYPPTDASDLDFHRFIRSSKHGWSHSEFESFLEAYSRKSGVKVQDSLSRWDNASLVEAMRNSEKSFRGPKTVQEEAAIFAAAEQRGQSAFWGKRDAEKRAFIQLIEQKYGRSPVYFNKEALVLIREGPDSVVTAEKLREFGFVNVFILVSR